ncbi:DMT family transporter [Mobilicoccus caccae]|uniref:EamA domain-containing protein n=1 Tax=Mobilicoccus caccae TaxID=1859295 RepID=A0ABQ6IPI5_9MICO|nr:DMT family transporter [Mobilicoccus caccae]GMA39366.1 hypothetical protein GCM10025883_14110 [Mobilicoccus caccae]
MSRQISGFGYAVGAAAAFSLSGSLGSGLMTTGWSAGAAVCARILIGALLLAPLAVVALRGKWRLVPGAAPRMILYGMLAVAGTQLAYFQAVRYLPVAVALLVEFAAPVAVLLWLWVTGGQRPSRLTTLGAVVAAAGLVIVLDLVSGVEVNMPGIAWSLAAMIGLAVYFVLSSDESHGLPPVAFATGGLVVGGLLLALAGAVGVLDIATSTMSPVYAGREVPWWVALGLLGAVTGGLAYVLGIEGARRLGSRLASFVGLTEVLFVALVAWLLLGETPTIGNVVGGVLVVTGVVLVKLGEPEAPRAEDTVEAAIVTPRTGVEPDVEPDEVSQWPSASGEHGREGL